MAERLQRDPFAVSRPAPQGGWFVIPLRRHEGYLEENVLWLADVAGRIWELLETPRARADLLAALLAEYEVAPEELSADIDPFLGRLLEMQAVFIEKPAG